MSTPTERLRALLDGRGAGWSTASGSACYTAWCVEHGIAQATDCGEGGGLLAVMFRCTPEQAVEATLGREETYTREDVEGAFVSGYSLGTFPVGSDLQWDENYQTVTEHMAELGWVRKATLGATPCRDGDATCRNDAPEPYYFVCSECGFGLNHMPNYCPRCGRKVEDE